MKQSFLRSPRDCLVVGAAIVIGFFVAGTARLSGLLFVTFLDRYHISREKASIPFIVSVTIMNLSSPITGYLGGKFDPRSVVLVGCFLAATGVGVCFLAEDFLVVIISWGGVYGLGFGMGCPLLPQILSEYFPRHFDKATGLVLCSVSVAGIILPILGDYSLKTYGVSGSFLILSSALLHTIPAAMILSVVTSNKRTPIKEEVVGTVSYPILKRNTKLADCEFESTRVSNEKGSSNLEIALEKSRSPKKEEDCECYRIPEHKKTEISGDGFMTNRVAEDEGLSHLQIPFEKAKGIEISSLLSEKQPHMNRKGQIENFETSPSALHKGRKRALDSFGLFLDPVYILMLLTQGVAFYVGVTMWTTVVDVARDHGVEGHKEVHVLEVLSFFEFLGRILLGYITDNGYISKTNFSSLCFVCLGVIISIFTCWQGFIFVMVAVSIVGLLIGFLTVVGFGIVHQYVEKKYRSMGFAAIYSVYGLMSFSQPPLIGYFRETLQSYNGLFYLMATMCFISSILTLLIPKVSMCRDRRNRKMKNDEQTYEK